MPLEMKDNFGDDDIDTEFYGLSHLEETGTFENHEVTEFKQSLVLTPCYHDPLNEAYLSTQVAGRHTDIMEAHNFFDEQTRISIQNLIADTTRSLPFFDDNPQLNVVNDVHEATSFGATATISMPCDEEFSHWFVEHSTGPSVELTDLPNMDSIEDAPIAPVPRKNITLVLDLDETLIHSAMQDDGADFSFPMMDGTTTVCPLYVKKRPHVDTFLHKVSEMFKVVIFTASVSSYANQLLDILDPENRIISQRYFRDSCVCEDGNYIKDLTVIEADLAKVAIIDNTPEVFQLQKNNGIPIDSWYSDPTDTALLKLIPFLETLGVAVDVRPINHCG